MPRKRVSETGPKKPKTAWFTPEEIAWLSNHTLATVVRTAMKDNTCLAETALSIGLDRLNSEQIAWIQSKGGLPEAMRYLRDGRATSETRYSDTF